MARIAGIDLPKNKRGEIGLTYIYGIGRSNARKILQRQEIDMDKKVQDWNDEEQNSTTTRRALVRSHREDVEPPPTGSVA